MLRALHIRDFVIVEHLELEFAAGFTALTGETGAGKSLLIDALSLVLGERSDTVWVREGADKADISAEFDISHSAELQRLLEAQDLRDGDQLIVRRVLERGGRSRAYLNGSPATVQQLKQTGEFLVDIHGQHMHQSLLRPQAQRALLDGFAGTGRLAGQVAEAFHKWQTLRAALADYEKNATALKREREEVQDKVIELKSLKPNAVEWEELEVEQRRISHAASLMQTAEEGLTLLSEGEATVLGMLHSLHARLAEGAALDPALVPAQELVEAGRIQIQEATHALRHYRDRVDIDPRRLSEVESRIQALHTAARKFRARPQELAQLLADLEKQLENLALTGDAQALAQHEAQAQDAYLQLARELGAKRKVAAEKLSRRVTDHLQQLAMTGSAFVIALEVLDEPGASGLESVSFQVTTHGASVPRSLGKVASGGELSRISLAIQTVTSEVADVPTLIFDEVDAGIGGAVAEIVGHMMRALSAKRQVMCVTHLPQVAAAASIQWRVVKGEAGGRVSSEVQALSKTQRVEEIARMLGGVKITETTRKHAAEMIGSAVKDG